MWIEPIDALSHWLVGQHLVLGDRVLIQMENRPEWAVVAFACARLGLALVPVYTTPSTGRH
jgi:Long-chain acyl-CoA synthetases (AMP-forming)